MTVAVIEDESSHRALICNYIEEWGRKSGTDIRLYQCESGEEFLFHCNGAYNFDIIFADIKMTGLNGMDMAKAIRKSDKNVNIVFATGVGEYMEEGYDVEAMHYLLKPLRREKVWECLERSAARQRNRSFVMVHTKDGLMRVEVSDIRYAEARGHICLLSLFSRKDPVEIKESISKMEDELKTKGFIRCHRSYICSIEAIYSIDRTDIYFEDKSSIPVSRRMYNAVNRAFIERFAGGKD